MLAFGNPVVPVLPDSLSAVPSVLCNLMLNEKKKNVFYVKDTESKKYQATV